MDRIKTETPKQSRTQRKPEFSAELLDETTRIWQPLSRRTLTREDGREIMENMTGFFRTLIEWKRREDEAAKTKPRHKTRACEGIPKYHRGGGGDGIVCAVFPFADAGEIIF
jgi:hypothetical protein